MLNDKLNSYSSAQSYKKGKIRFTLLFLIVFVAFGNQYAFNNPQALEETLYEHLHITQTQFQLFYSLYSLPNIFTLLCIGYFLDKFGMRLGIVILSFAIVVCQLIFAIGGQVGSYSMMLTGRVLFGIASRSLFIPQASLISFWFKGRELSFALGIGITFPELGNALNSYLTPLIYQKTSSIGTPLFVSVVICFLGFLGALLVFKIDKKAEDLDLQNDVKSELSQYTLQTEQSKHQTIKLRDLKQLSPTFWIISILCTLTMSQYIPFLDNANRLFQKRFCFTQTTAGQVITVTYIATAVFSGPLGLLVNKVGKRRYFIIGATFIFFIAHTIIWLEPQCELATTYSAIWGLLLIGIGFSFYANVIVAAIPMVVQRKVLGSALGIMEIMSSLFQCIVPMMTGYLIGTSESTEIGFKNSSFFFFLLGLSGVLSSFLLFFIDRKLKKKLDKGQIKQSFQKQNLDDIEIPSQYKKIADERPSGFKFTKTINALFNRNSDPGIELSSKQLY